jgi:hypothetical protein
MFAGAFDVAFEGAADEVARAKANSQGQRKDNAAEEDSECQLNNDTTDLEMIEHHGGSKNKHEPLDAKGEEARVLEMRVDGSNEHRPRQETRDQGARDENEDGSDGVG